MKITLIILVLTNLLFNNCHHIKLEKDLANKNPGHIIKIDTATKIISDFLLYSDLRKNAESYTFGGFIDFNSISFIDDIKVIKFYICYDKNLFKNKIFLAYKTFNINDAYNSDCYNLMDNDILIKSESNFNFKGTGISRSYIKNYLYNLNENTLEVDKDSVIFGKDAIKFAEEFITQYTIDGNSIQNDICLTMNKEEVDKLRIQYDSLSPNLNKFECKGLRYFFGFESGINNSKSNKIRLVFVGAGIKIDEKLYDNKNLIYYDTDKKHSALFLEKNWPPD
jgi:hypothetical protein